MTDTNRTIRERDVVRLHRPSGELVFSTQATQPPPLPDEIVAYQDRQFTVREIVPQDDGTTQASAYLIPKPGDEPALSTLDLLIRKVNVDPGDVIVLEARRALTTEEAKAIKAQVEQAFPAGVVVLIIDDGLRFRAVLDPAKAQLLEEILS